MMAAREADPSVDYLYFEILLAYWSNSVLPSVELRGQIVALREVIDFNGC